MVQKFFRHGKYRYDSSITSGDRKLRADDSDMWIQYWPISPYYEQPMKFVIGIEGRKIGFSIDKKLSETVIDIDPVTELPIYEFRHFGIVVSDSDSDGWLKRTNTTKFANAEQQQRALRFIQESFLAFPGRGTKRAKEGLLGAIVKFSPELVKKFENGDFIG